MAYGDPVLQRPLFQTSPGLTPSVGGTSPDDNARALRNLFAPTVSIDAPAQMIQQEQQPVQSFQTGGEVIDPSGFFPGTEPIPQEPAGPDSSGFATENLTGIRGLLQRGALGLRSLRPQPPAPPPAAAAPPAPSGGAFSVADIGVGGGEVYSADPSRTLMSQAGTRMVDAGVRPAAAPARPKGIMELTLDGIKEERSRLAAEKKQNALLALMQAGFAMAAGRSPNALSNIAAGGQAGVGAFAAMEKDRRADLSALRREETAVILERERMRAQEERAPETVRTYAALGGWNPANGREGFDEAVRRGIEVTKSLEREPDTMRLIKALGGGDLVRGFEVYKGDESLKAAQATVGNYAASEEDRRRAQNYLNARIQQSLQSLQGQGGRTPPAGSTVIPLNQLPVR